MESIKQALGGAEGDELVRLLRAVERGDHHSIDGSAALAQFERLTKNLAPQEFVEVTLAALAAVAATRAVRPPLRPG